MKKELIIRKLIEFKNLIKLLTLIFTYFSLQNYIQSLLLNVLLFVDTSFVFLQFLQFFLNFSYFIFFISGFVLIYNWIFDFLFKFFYLHFKQSKLQNITLTRTEKNTKTFFKEKIDEYKK